VGIGLLLGDERPLFAPVFGMVDGIGALAPLAKEPAATQASSFRVGTFDTRPTGFPPPRAVKVSRSQRMPGTIADAS
jgi:hypothetical protein